jgi:hypothetical protein
MKGIRPVLWWLPLAALLVFTSPAQAQVPGNPAVSVSADVKKLNFWWNRVAGATRYELWFRPTTDATWVKYAVLPGTRTSLGVNISVHLFNWQRAIYVLKACNTSGCGRTPHIYVSHLMQQTVGMFGLVEGGATDISEDGITLAATAGAAVEVFRKSSTGWAREAALAADPLSPDIWYPPVPAVSVSGNGNVIALGVDAETPAGVDPADAPRVGAVYLFRRTSNGWAREQKLNFSPSVPEDAFGLHLDLDESGTVLAAWRRFGDPPYPDPGAWRHQGVVEMFKYSAGSWVRQTPIPTLYDACDVMRLSGDGNTLVKSCGGFVEVLTAPTWQRVARLANPLHLANEYVPGVRTIAVSHDGRSFAVRSVDYDGELSSYFASVNVYRLGSAGWAREATLLPGSWEPQGFEGNSYGLYVALSRDGRFLAVGDRDDHAAGEGAVYPPITYGGSHQSAVYVYERKSGGWGLRQFLKPNASASEISSIGGPLAFGRNGKDLAVGSYYGGPVLSLY